MADTLNPGHQVMINQDEVIQFTQSIVRQSSITGDEGALGRWLARILKEIGLRVKLQEVAPERYNILATLRGNRPELGLLLHAHMDIVPLGAMTDPLSAEIQDGHIWGRGSVDQKGGLAAAVMALKAVAQSGIQLDQSLGLALVVDEESEHRGSMALVDEVDRPGSFFGAIRQAIITEPSGQRLVIGCKGTTPYQVLVKGKAAHGCRPWLGTNAVHQAMRVVTALEQVEYVKHNVPDYGPVKGSLNLGVIQGGRAYNIVPDECRVWFDRRTVPGEAQEMVLGQVQAILDRLANEEPGVESTLSVARPDWDWEPIRQRGLLPAVTPPGTTIQEMVDKHHKAVSGSPAEIYFTDGYNEMDFLINDLGIPTVQYGPGDSGLCHTDEERLCISQLIDTTRIYARIALEAATKKGS